MCWSWFLGLGRRRAQLRQHGLATNGSTHNSFHDHPSTYNILQSSGRYPSFLEFKTIQNSIRFPDSPENPRWDSLTVRSWNPLSPVDLFPWAQRDASKSRLRVWLCALTRSFGARRTKIFGSQRLGVKRWFSWKFLVLIDQPEMLSNMWYVITCCNLCRGTPNIFEMGYRLYGYYSSKVVGNKKNMFCQMYICRSHITKKQVRI